MSPIAPTQALPAQARTVQSASAAPSQGVPGGFGDALIQALASPEPASSAVPAIPAPAAMAAPPAQALPVLPTVAATPQAEPAAIDSVKPEKDEPPAETEENKPSVEATKPSEDLQAPAPCQPILPTLPQAAPTVAQPVALPSEAGDAAPSTEKDSPAAFVAGIDGGQQPSSVSAPAAAQEDKQSVEAARPSDKAQAPAPFQPLLPVPPQAAPTVTLPSEAGDAAPSAGQDSAAATASGIDGRQQPPSASAPAAAQTAAPPASAPPSHAAAPSKADDTAAPILKHSASVTAEEEPSIALPAEAASLPPVASAPLPATPAPLGVAPHPAPVPSQAPARSPAADRPAPPPAAVQVGPVLASFAAGASHPGAPQHLTIRLDPTDLGRVQVRIERAPDGSARVELKVEKPDTLLMLLRDQPQLHRALDLAGVPSAERTLQFHLAPPDAAAPGGMAAQSNADGGHGQHRPGQPHSGRFAAHGAPSSVETTSGPAAFRRAGIDITA